MMSPAEELVPQKHTCGNCSEQFECAGGGDSDICKCPGCSARTFHRTLEASVQVIPAVTGKGRRGGKGKPFVRFKIAKEWWRDGQKFIARMYCGDREKDHYSEKVVDPDTGQIVHQCDEPLSDHYKKQVADEQSDDRVKRTRLKS